MNKEYRTITLHEVRNWCTHNNGNTDKLLDVITGKYSLRQMRKDILDTRKRENELLVLKECKICKKKYSLEKSNAFSRYKFCSSKCEYTQDTNILKGDEQ